MSAPPWLPFDLVRATVHYFRRHGIESPRLDAELLLAHVLEVERLGLYLGFETPVGEPERSRYRALVKRRALERVPVAYLVGAREFWSRSFRVTPDVLIPRPETELLVEITLTFGPSRIADVGTGSGAIAAALALELPHATLSAIDCI